MTERPRTARQNEGVAQQRAAILARLPPISIRLMGAVEFDLFGGCWLWSRSLAGDYGSIRRDGRRIKAHRASYEAHVGPVPAGLWVLHKCDTPLCINPNHLFIGTPRDNTQDCFRKGRRRPSRGGDHYATTLTEERVLEILHKIASGARQADLIRECGVSASAVEKLRAGVSWKHLPRPPMPARRRPKMDHAAAGELRRRRAAGEGLSDLAADYGITKQNAGQICLGRVWRPKP